MSTMKVALDLVPEKIGGLIKDYREDLEQAWAKKEDNEDLTVTFSTKFFIHQGRNTCEVSMARTSPGMTNRQNSHSRKRNETDPFSFCNFVNPNLYRLGNLVLRGN
jgi:hypothetical protein